MAGGKVYPNEVKRMFLLPGGPIGKATRRVALDIAKESKRIAESELGKNPGDRPRTGQYARGFRVVVDSGPAGFVFRVENKKKYAAYIEKGTRPHTIRARRTRYLRFPLRSGGWANVKVVSHPGSKAFRILQRASEIVVRKM